MLKTIVVWFVETSLVVDRVRFCGFSAHCCVLYAEQLYTPVAARRRSVVFQPRRKFVTVVECLSTRLRIHVAVSIHWQQTVARVASSTQLPSAQLASQGVTVNLLLMSLTVPAMNIASL